MTRRAPAVLFVCVSNAGKSVMAQHLMRHHAGDAITAQSAGTNPKTAINDLSAHVLAELGIDTSSHRPAQLTNELVDHADLVIIVGNQAHIDPAPHSGLTPID